MSSDMPNMFVSRNTFLMEQMWPSSLPVEVRVFKVRWLRTSHNNSMVVKRPTPPPPQLVKKDAMPRVKGRKSLRHEANVLSKSKYDRKQHRLLDLTKTIFPWSTFNCQLYPTTPHNCSVVPDKRRVDEKCISRALNALNLLDWKSH